MKGSMLLVKLRNKPLDPPSAQFDRVQTPEYLGASLLLLLDAAELCRKFVAASRGH